MTTPLAAPAARTCPHTPPCTLGADLHKGSVVVDLAGHEHTIDHFRAYPGQYKGDTARRAYDAGETWRATVGDHEHFHCLPDEEGEPAMSGSKPTCTCPCPCVCFCPANLPDLGCERLCAAARAVDRNEHGTD